MSEHPPKVTIEQLEDNVKSSRHADKRQKWILFWLVGVTTLLAFGLLALYMDTRGRAEASAEVAATEQQQKVEVAEEARQALCGDADQEIYDRDLCEKWSGIADEGPVEITEPPVVIGGPSRAELVQAFGEYCAQGNCQGRDGAKPTPDEVASAFARFCSDGRCTGPAGADGADGAAGENGADAPPPRAGVDGADAPPPTLELMAAAVTQYCSAGACVGPGGADAPPPTPEAVTSAVIAFCSTGACTGPPGANGTNGLDGQPGSPGADGAPGRSLVDVECQQVPDYAWIFTYSDGTTETEPGPCRAFAVTPPDPGPTQPTTPPTPEAP